MKPMDREDALAYIANFDLEPALLGAAIAAGRQHSVYLYGDTQVVKLPNQSLYMRLYGAIAPEAIERDVHILTTMLPKYVVPTQVLRSRTDPEAYVVLQEHLPHARFISGTEYHRVRDELEEIVLINHTIIEQHRLSIDFFSYQGFRQSMRAFFMRRKQEALLNNLLIVDVGDDAQIRITDVNLSELRVWLKGDVNLFHWIVDNGVFLLTRIMLRDLFNLRI
jgi:hypothetical protein